MAGAVPLVEIADHADDVGVGGPDGEAHALDVAFAHGVRAQHAIAFVMVPSPCRCRSKGVKEEATGAACTPLLWHGCRREPNCTCTWKDRWSRKRCWRSIPSLTREEIAAQHGYTDFAGFLKSFVWVNSGCGRPADYARVARRLFERLESEGVTYAEVILSVGVVLWKEQDLAPIYDALAREAARADHGALDFRCDPPVRRGAGEAGVRSGGGAGGRRRGGDRVGRRRGRGPARLFGDLYARRAIGACA